MDFINDLVNIDIMCDICYMNMYNIAIELINSSMFNYYFNKVRSK